MPIRNPSALLTELGATGNAAAALGGDGVWYSPEAFGIGMVAELGIGIDTPIAAGDLLDGSQLYSDRAFTSMSLYWNGPPGFPPEGTQRNDETWMALNDYGSSSEDFDGSVVVGLFKRVGYSLAVPRVDHLTGTYNNDFVAAITCGTPDVDLRYTLDGSDVTEHSTLTLDGLIPIDGTLTAAGMVTLKFAAFRDTFVPSAQGSATYTLQAAAPTFDPPPPALSPTNITLADATVGASLFYTTNGSTPTPASTPYTVPVAIVPPMSLKAVAAKSGYADSAVAISVYTAQTPAVVAALFASGEQGGYWDFHDPTTLYGDVARTIPVEETGDVANFAYDMSGKGNHVAYNNAYGIGPRWDSDGFVTYLPNQQGPLLYALAANLPQPFTLVVAYKELTDEGFIANINVNDVRIKATGAGQVEGYAGVAANLAPFDTDPHVLTVVFNGALSKSRLDGVETVVNLGLNAPLTGQFFALGGSSNGGTPHGNIYQALLISRALTPTERANVEALFLSLM